MIKPEEPIIVSKEEVEKLGIVTTDTTHSIFGKWMNTEFVEFKDGDTDNFEPDNLIPRELEYCMKQYSNPQVVTNWDMNLTLEEKLLVHNKKWRDSLYFKVQDRNRNATYGLIERDARDIIDPKEPAVKYGY